MGTISTPPSFSIPIRKHLPLNLSPSILLFPSNHHNRYRRPRTRNHMFRMKRRQHHLLRQTRHTQNNIRHLSREPIKARGRGGHKVGKDHIGLLTSFDGGVVDVGVGIEHCQVVEDVFVCGVDVTGVGVGECGGVFVEGRVVLEDPVLGHAEWGLGYDFFVAKCLSRMKFGGSVKHD